MDKITQPEAISGRRLSAVESGPRLNPEARVIRTGLFFIEEVTGRKLAVYMCSEEQGGGSWLVDESDTENRGRCVANCSREPGTEEWHKAISLSEALRDKWLNLGGLNGGAVMIDNEDLVDALVDSLRKTASQIPEASNLSV